MALNEKFLSKHQLNKLGILKNIYISAKHQYIEALEIYLRVFNNTEDCAQWDNLKFDNWRHRLDIAYHDMLKCFDRYNKAFNSYTSYYSICLGA